MGQSITNKYSLIINNKWSILVFTSVIILYRYVTMQVYGNIDLSSLYYHRSIGEKMVYLVNNGTIGLVMILFLISSGKVSLNWKVALKAILLSIVMFLMVLSWNSSLTFTNTWFFNWFILLAVIIFVQVKYLLDFSIRDLQLWLTWLIIGMFSFFMAYAIMFVIYVFSLILPPLYALLFPNFGDGTALGFALFSGLLGSLILIRIFSVNLYDNVSEKSIEKRDIEPQQRSSDGMSRYINLIRKYAKYILNFDFLIIVFTLSPAVWMACAFIFDQAIDQDISIPILWFIYLLTIPYSIFLSLRKAKKF